MKTTTSKSSVVTQILFSAVATVLGYLLLFKPAIQVTTLCQILCGGLVAVGVVAIVSFFLSGDFKRIDRYGFAIGTMLIILGCIGLLRINDVTAHFEMYTGALSLVLGVLVLQGTVQMKVLDYAVWVLNLVLTLACLAGAIFVLAGVTPVTNLVQGFSSWTLLVCGAACLLSMFVTWICILLAGRREKKEQKEREAEAAAQAQAAAQAEAAAQAQAAQAAAQAQPSAQTPAPAQSQAASDILPGEYVPIPAPEKPSYDQPVKPSEPAETYHTGFDPAADAASDLPPTETPQLVFEPSEGHHTDFQP